MHATTNRFPSVRYDLPGAVLFVVTSLGSSLVGSRWYGRGPSPTPNPIPNALFNADPKRP